MKFRYLATFLLAMLTIGYAQLEKVEHKPKPTSMVDFGDLGASDLIGEINNRTKNSIFKFQKNVFIDDIKKFNKKFEIKNNTNENPTEISFSGKLNLGNFDFDLHQISKGKNIINKEESINAVNTFKKIMLTKNLESLINFENLKKFVKTIME